MTQEEKAAFFKCADIASNRARDIQANREEVKLDPVSEIIRLAHEFRKLGVDQ